MISSTGVDQSDDDSIFCFAAALTESNFMRWADLARRLSAVIIVTMLSWNSGSFAADSPPVTRPYLWKSVAIHGGGFVAGIVTHPTARGLMYARTDVGGAYRWDTDHWVAITDWVSQTDGSLLGCESIAVDPSDPDRVYLALGMYTNNWAGNGAIVRSDNRGQTFERTDMPFKMGGNDDGRSIGERLIVDPNDGRVLFFGSREAGLWESVDQAKTWKQVRSFPAVATSLSAKESEAPQWPLGISFVKFDASSGKPGSPTPTLYAGVCTQETSLFRSVDGGVSWNAVPNQPTGLRPNHMVVTSDGRLYISYGDQAGPNECTNGAIFELNSKTDQWTDVTPVHPSQADKFGYGAVTLDPHHPNLLMASSIDRWSHGDTVFRTLDGGQHWSSETVGGNHRDKSLFNATGSPWAASMAPHWLGDIELDPFDSDHASFVTGYGIWSTHDASAMDSGKPAHWAFADAGLEETVPLELVSPPVGAHLISVIGDFDGFTHDDLDVSPLHGRHQPSIGSTRGLDFAAMQPQFVVRAGGRGQGFYSTDGGENWTAFTSSPPGRALDGGSVAVSADGANLVWYFGRAGTFWSSDMGATWRPSSGLPHTARPISDRVNPKRFYAVDESTGHVFASTDSGATFEQTALQMSSKDRAFRAVPGHEGHIWFCTGDALYQSVDGGKSARKISTVSGATKVGFGKAAPGKDYPAIFLVGQVDGVTGLFRSDDTGDSWIRINDENHQYGWIDIVIGDPRIFGRVYIGTSGRGVIYGDPSPK